MNKFLRAHTQRQIYTHVHTQPWKETNDEKKSERKKWQVRGGEETRMRKGGSRECREGWRSERRRL